MRPFHKLLLKLIAFALVYGLIFCNWVDLFNGGAYTYVVPAYHIWFLCMLFMPFFISLIFYGRKDVELFFTLGLLASLMNDLFYFVIGDAFFGFKVALIPWWLNQLGFNGWKPCFVFNGGFFHFTVVSWMMGLTIYTRIFIVCILLAHYWGKRFASVPPY
jgi:hypothetical protein